MELFEKSIDSFYGTYKKPGLLGKKYNVKILLFDDRVEGSAFALIENEIQSEPKSFSITFDKIERISAVIPIITVKLFIISPYLPP